MEISLVQIYLSCLQHFPLGLIAQKHMCEPGLFALFSTRRVGVLFLSPLRIHPSLQNFSARKIPEG